jgi:hypothetical protein
VAQLAEGESATLGLRVAGYLTTSPESVGFVGDWMLDLYRVSGLNALGAARAEQVAAQRLAALTGWDAFVQLAANGATVDVYVYAPTLPSSWRVFGWVAPAFALSNTVDTTAPTITTATLDQSPTSATVAITLAANETVTWYLSESNTLPGSPTWIAAPSTFAFAGTGARTLYIWARDTAGNVTASPTTRTTTVPVVDTTAPTITTATLDQSPTSATVAITLAANETVTWYLSESNTLPGSPTWIAAPSTFAFAGTGARTLYIWARDTAGNVTASPTTRTTTVPVGNVVYWSDDFERANGAVGNNWTAVNSAVGTIASGDLVRTDAGDFRRLQHNGGGALPADYYVTWHFPAATQGQWFGFAGRITGANGIQVLWRYDAAPATLTMGAGAIGPDLMNNFPTVTGTVPASWGTGPCAFTMRFNGAVGTLYFNGVEYATFDATVGNGVAGSSIASIGEGANRHYTAVEITNYLPAYP